MTTRRELHRQQTMTSIVRVGREQLVSVGAANLSVRAIAREIGVVSSAVYRYVPSRDELLTELVVDAYLELGAEVSAAHDAVAAEDLPGRLRAIGTGMRSWALREPGRWALLFGSPVSGYRAPPERTNGPGLIVATLLLRLLSDAATRRPAPEPPLPAPLHAELDRMAAILGVETSDRQAHLALLTWSSLLGWISAEVFGTLAGLEQFEAIFDYSLGTLTTALGLPADQVPTAGQAPPGGQRR